MLETNVAEQWLYAVLSADTVIAAIVGTRIYARQASQGVSTQLAPRPYIIYQSMSGADSQGIGTVRQMALPLYLVKVLCDNAPTQAVRTVADKIDDIVGKAVAQTISYGGFSWTISGRREQPFELTENATTTLNRIDHLGGLYRLRISQQ